VFRLALAAIVLTPLTVLADAPEAVRFATFNASLNRFNAGDLATELAAPGSAQPDTIAEIIQRVRPDVLLINEFDYDPGGVAAQGFQDNYLSVAHGDAAPIVYPYRFLAPSNTGIPSGFDLDNDGAVGGPNDAFGFGFFPGQYGMVIYSMYPVDVDAVRTFQLFLWRDMPGALLPTDPSTGLPWYSDDELDVLRLSSKSHWDVPVLLPARGAAGRPATVHLLASHPTPPVFDGPEDRNGRRNHDESRFWSDYIDDREYFIDDSGRRGGLAGGADFELLGDLGDGEASEEAELDHLVLELEAVRLELRQGPVQGDDLQQPLLQTLELRVAQEPGLKQPGGVRNGAGAIEKHQVPIPPGIVAHRKIHDPAVDIPSFVPERHDPFSLRCRCMMAW